MARRRPVVARACDGRRRARSAHPSALPQGRARAVHRDGWTYTVDTLNSFDPADELWLILGSDAAANLPTWNRADEVLERARVAVAPRPGTEAGAVESVLGSVTWLDMPALQVSGTEIRARATAGKSIRFLVPEPVWRYVEEHAIYRPV